MTECRSEKIRNLIITHLGKEDLEKYDATVNACKLGNALKDERVWAPLCREYHNLKGVTCEEINAFLDDSISDFFFTDEYEQIADDITYKYRKASEEAPIGKHGDLPPGFGYHGEGYEIKKEFLDRIKPHITEKDFERVEKFASRYPSIISTISNIKEREPKKFTEDYLHHVKVYDRDETYEAFKNIGDWIEVDTPGILKDPSTIFVTTPRGGHEMLSIFTYANDIDKTQIPSDIKWTHASYRDRDFIAEETYKKHLHNKTPIEDPSEYITESYGVTWLGDVSEPVNTIFIVDDIIASGEQVHKTAMKLEEMFPDATINSVTLCKRSDDVVSPALPMEIKKYYTDAETIGIHEFKIANRNKIPMEVNQYITCLFPHACPDGASDSIIIDLMGGDRCPPEKRIARRDL